MKIISAKYIFTGKELLINKAVAFDKHIKKIDTLSNLRSQFKDAKIYLFEDNHIIYPGFINPHVHLEFSTNKATLDFDGFTNWLYSVIANREELIAKLNPQTIHNEIESMLNSGITTFGAISSYGAEIKECKEAPQRVIFFNEVIGSSPAMVDALFNDFKARLEESLKLNDDKFISGIAIHSPYSVHPILIREALKIAKDKNLLTTAHFLESPSEREWLESGSGEFRAFFEKFLKTTKPVNTIENFLEAFNDKPTLFTHCTQCKDEEFEIINANNHSIIHCPRSNRLLDCGKLDISKAKNLLLGTDGLSSNYSLSILDELKIALFMHTNFKAKELSIKLIQSITINAAKALNLKIGQIKEDYFADFAIFKLPNDFEYNDAGSATLHTILNCNSAKSIFIDGQKVV